MVDASIFVTHSFYLHWRVAHFGFVYNFHDVKSVGGWLTTCSFNPLTVLNKHCALAHTRFTLNVLIFGRGIDDGISSLPTDHSL